jgi:hypothetical protein
LRQLPLAMCTHFLTFIAGKINFDESADVTTADMASSMWFIFDMLIKSMAIKLHQEQQLGAVFFLQPAVHHMGTA